MNEDDYSKREIDEKFTDIKLSLERIEIQTSKTNGRVTRIETISLIVTTVIVVLLITNGSELLQVFKILI